MRTTMRFAIPVALALAYAADAAASTPVPHSITVQGVLRNVAGELSNGTFDLRFRLYATATCDPDADGSCLLHEETRKGMGISGGLFSVELGLPSDANPFQDRTQAWLGIKVGLDAELGRKPVTSVGFALQAEHSDKADELTGPASDLVCERCVASTDLAPGLTLNGTTTLTGPLSSTWSEGPPFLVSSQTAVTNLNADLLDGKHASDYVTFEGGLIPESNLPRASATTFGVVRVDTAAGLSVSGGVLGNSGMLGLGVTAPLTTTGGQNPAIAIPSATASRDGYLATTDFSRFDGKAAATGAAGYVWNQDVDLQPAKLRINGNASARAFVDSDGPSYYLDPASTGTSALLAGAVGIGTVSPGTLLDVSGGNIRTSGQFVSTSATAAPLSVLSSTLVANLNADQVDGHHAADFAPAGGGASGYVQNQFLAPQTADFWISGNGTAGGTLTSASGRFATDLGIGTPTPSSTLDVTRADTAYWRPADGNWGAHDPAGAVTITNSQNGGYDPVLVGRMSTATGPGGGGGLVKTVFAIGAVGLNGW